MNVDDVERWLEPPSENDLRDAFALIGAFHRHDQEGLSAVLAHCDTLATLKAYVAIFESFSRVLDFDPCTIELHVDERGGPA